ncbi:hypothetical protein [Devosia ginsengisoli]|uniref:hypothetical protein n=1 Tax=Devosia ginsengisoli TaxID=400770 RepID=UPI0026F11E4A|nr:hypothetical protein [Devosia ginsengisoli]MCR6673243.1 hypothetical protein [Devosia ginsengisoli]
MITSRWIRKLQADGYIPRPAPGKVALVAAVQGYIKSLKDEDRRSTKTASDSRVRDARAAEIEMRIAERKRELIPIEDAAAAMDLLAGKTKEEMTGLAARITRDMELRRKIEAEVNGAQSRIADALRASAEFARKGGDLPYSSSADDA